MSSHKLAVWGSTDVGCVRQHNEDTILVDENEQLFVVADGMGGERGGGYASSLAVNTIRDYFSDSGRDTEPVWPFDYIQSLDLVQNRMRTAIKLANQNIRMKAHESDEL